jgi:dTDP-4-amino-4,6-dideoxygalactose transaminase
MQHARMLANIYDDALMLIDEVDFQYHPNFANSAYWLYTIMVQDRDNFADFMNKNGIMVSKVHERNDKHSCMKDYKALLPSLDYIAEKMISIPMGWWVSEEDAHYICDKIGEFYGRVERKDKK